MDPGILKGSRGLIRITHPFLVLQRDRAQIFQNPVFTSRGTFVWLEATYKNTIQLLSKQVANSKLASKHLAQRRRLLRRVRCSFAISWAASLKAKLGFPTSFRVNFAYSNRANPTREVFWGFLGAICQRGTCLAAVNGLMLECRSR